MSMDRPTAMERSLDMSELERIADVLQSCANMLDSEPRFRVSGTSVRQVIYNMAAAVLVYKAAETKQEPVMGDLLELGSLSYRVTEVAEKCGMQVQVVLTKGGGNG